MKSFSKVNVGQDARTELAAGDWLRIVQAAKRQLFAGSDSAISYVCIQVKANSLEAYTADDAEIHQ